MTRFLFLIGDGRSWGGCEEDTSSSEFFFQILACYSEESIDYNEVFFFCKQHFMIHAVKEI